MKRTYVEIQPTHTKVLSAYEYSKVPVSSNTPMHPLVQLSYDFWELGYRTKTNTVMIKDRYVLFNLLKNIDDSLAYSEMMSTLYYSHPSERPSLSEIIQGYLNLRSTPMGLWVDEDEDGVMHVLSVENEGHMSRYHETTKEFIGAQFLCDYTIEANRTMKDKNGLRRPVMRYTKKTPAFNKIRIEVLSYNNNTYVCGALVRGSVAPAGIRRGITVQPVPEIKISGYAHLIPAEKLGEEIAKVRKACEEHDDFLMRVEYVQWPKGSSSSRLENFHERNKAENEVWEEIFS